MKSGKIEGAAPLLSTNIFRLRPYFDPAQRGSENTQWLLKVPASDTAEVHERLERETALFKSLDFAGVLRPAPITPPPEGAGATEGILYPGFPGGRAPLAEIGPGKPLSLERFARAAGVLTRLIGELHARGYALLNIGPGTFLWRETPQTCEALLCDLTFAMNINEAGRIPGAEDAVLNLPLEYISPEATGRINREVDYRTDLYSLGIYFYNLLTGRPPFQAKEPLQLIYAHTALLPPSPASLNSEISQPLESLILRLLSKEPDERPRSIRALEEELESLTDIHPEKFPTRKRPPSAGQPRDKNLYGREVEIKKLTDSFERTRAGGRRLVTVTGIAGVGKSALARTLKKRVLESGAFFLSGKFDQFSHDKPYDVFIQSFREFIELVLVQGEERLNEIRRLLLETLGENAGVIAEIIPEIETVIGRQPPETPLPPREARNRINSLFRNLSGAIASPARPLVFFLDDLHWADLDSLRLLRELLELESISGLLVVVAYRDGEVDEKHALNILLNEFNASRLEPVELRLSPLSAEALRELLNERLPHQESYADAFANRILAVTGGNPFFIEQFLADLQKRGLLRFDPSRAFWIPDESALQAIPLNEDLTRFMEGRLRALPAFSLGILQNAACIGVTFDLAMLTGLSGGDKNQIKTALEEAGQEGLIAPVSRRFHENKQEGKKKDKAAGKLEEARRAEENKGAAPEKYQFLHDHVQRAAYELLSPSDRQATHRRIAEILLALPDEGAATPGERLFEIVHQQNAGLQDLELETASMRLPAARLNLQAGLRAKSRAAFEAARAYFQNGIRLLPVDHRELEYELSFTLHIEYAECIHLVGDFERAEKLYDELLTWRLRTIELGRVYVLKMTLLQTRSRYDEVINTGLGALRMFGIKLPSHPSRFRVILTTLKTRYRFHRITEREIEKLPIVRSPEDILIQSLLLILHISAFVGPARNLAGLIICRLIKISGKRGISPHSSYAFGFFSTMLIAFLEDYRSGSHSARLGRALEERFDSPTGRGRALFLFGATADVWENHCGKSLPVLTESLRISQQYGDYIYSNYSLLFLIRRNFIMGTNLEKILEIFAPYQDFALRNFDDGVKRTLYMLLGFILNLRGKTENAHSLNNKTYPEFNEAEHVNRLIADNSWLFLCWYYPLKGKTLYLQGACEEAIAALAPTEKYIHYTLPGNLVIVENTYWLALSLARVLKGGSNQNPSRKNIPAYYLLLRQCLRKLKRWARIGPANFEHKYLLVRGEERRLRGRYEKAMEDYDRAIDLATREGFIHHAALGAELASRLARRRKKEFVARAYQDEARRLYTLWGAVAPLKRLKSEKP